MQEQLLNYIKDIIKNMPAGWLATTTHRLDIYNESLAKVEFLNHFTQLYNNYDASTASLESLPTAYDYIRLGHPLSCILEWTIARLNQLEADNVIAFSSRTAPILAVCRKNHLANKKTRLIYFNDLPEFLDIEKIKTVYNYDLETLKVNNLKELKSYDGSTILLANETNIKTIKHNEQVDFSLSFYGVLGSLLTITNASHSGYVADIQHVRRRETIAMTPVDSLKVLHLLINNKQINPKEDTTTANHKAEVKQLVQKTAGVKTEALIGSSGLSIQYAIMMGLIDHAQQANPDKSIKFVVPPNCYGGTNDQARRVAACIDNVEIVDLPVDGNNDMVRSVDKVLTQLAQADAIPYIIAEIPTNPRVEVPDLDDLKAVLNEKRQTPQGTDAVTPVFILDQTFCPNVPFMTSGEALANIKTISYSSGSKFPSGGKCTAGYCIGNELVTDMMDMISNHLTLCDNEATALQYEILAQQMPSMNKRITAAYENTRTYVEFIKTELPEAKINFVSDNLASRGFTPSVFSLDLPTKGDTAQEREDYKRNLNLKLIHKMINEIPNESKFCVSYGQLKGVYWTVPATSTQGTTKEEDKDYIVRASLSAHIDLEKHKEVFSAFVKNI